MAHGQVHLPVWAVPADLTSLGILGSPVTLLGRYRAAVTTGIGRSSNDAFHSFHLSVGVTTQLSYTLGGLVRLIAHSRIFDWMQS